MSIEQEAVSARGALTAALGLLSPTDRRKYRFVVAAQMTTSLLDVIGVLLLGVVGVLAASAMQGTGVPSAFDSVLTQLGLEDLAPASLAAWCAALAALFLLSKSVLSAYLMRRVYRFLGSRQGSVSAGLVERVMAQPLLMIERRSSQEIVYAISTGVSTLITSMLGALASFLSEVTLLLVLFVTFVLIDPVVTLAAAAYFALVGYAIHKGLGAWAERVGETNASTSVRGQQRLQEAIVAYREIVVLGRRRAYTESIAECFRMAGKASGDSLFLMQLPKIAYEAALVIGGVALVAWQFASVGVVQAVGTVVLFVAAGSRVLPSMLRINMVNLAIRNGVGQAGGLLRLVRELDAAPQSAVTVVVPEDSGKEYERDAGFEPIISLEAVGVIYPGATSPALIDVSLMIESGQRIAIVGATGAGKSTLADVILGVLSPQDGRVLISGMSPQEVIARWPGAIAYVPQHVAMINGSVRENVALGLPSDVISDDMVWEALARASLADFLTDQRDGIDTVVGERGVRLSGGQRQRLGLARALYSSPRLLVLDEATSALDSETESLISEALNSLSRDVTTVTIAHRLATIRHADCVVFLDQGHVRDIGTFAEVRDRNPAFERQAELSGIAR
ncbi:MAG: ABC transporter ATP-binding protein [Actinomycetota bacterium]|nr:ABC transporter ATP-binding protein [Actinomycetota bacterium]